MKLKYIPISISIHKKVENTKSLPICTIGCNFDTIGNLYKNTNSLALLSFLYSHFLPRFVQCSLVIQVYLLKCVQSLYLTDVVVDGCWLVVVRAACGMLGWEKCTYFVDLFYPDPEVSTLRTVVSPDALLRVLVGKMQL